jgi:class 3 adenylate cyclase
MSIYNFIYEKLLNFINLFKKTKNISDISKSKKKLILDVIDKTPDFSCFDNAPCGVIISRNQVIIYVNDNICDITEFTKNELYNNFTSVILENNLVKTKNNFTKNIKITRSNHYEFCIYYLHENNNVKLLEKALENCHQLENSKREIARSVIPNFLIDNFLNGQRNFEYYHEDIIIAFFDIKEYTKLTCDSSIFPILKAFYCNVDILCEKYDIFLVEIIGDCVMFANNMLNSMSFDNSIKNKNKLDLETIQECLTSGILNKKNSFDSLDTKTLLSDDPAENMILMLLECIKFGNELNLQIRCGISRGKCISGLVGHNKFSYHFFGNAVNMAARMEQMAIPNTIKITNNFYDSLKNKNKFNIVSNGSELVKGKGEVETYTITKKIYEETVPLFYNI